MRVPTYQKTRYKRQKPTINRGLSSHVGRQDRRGSIEGGRYQEGNKGKLLYAMLSIKTHAMDGLDQVYTIRTSDCNERRNKQREEKDNGWVDNRGGRQQEKGNEDCN